jgi:hypothetical protein
MKLWVFLNSPGYRGVISQKIGGGYLVWLWLHEDRPSWYAHAKVPG